MIGLTYKNTSVIIYNLNKLSKAKVLNVKQGEIEIDDEDVYDLFNTFKNHLKDSIKSLTNLLRHYNDEESDRRHYCRKIHDDYDEDCKESLFKETTSKLDLAISILESIYDSDEVEEGYFEHQLYLLKDRLVWLRLVLDMSEDEIQDELVAFNFDELETSRR